MLYHCINYHSRNCHEERSTKGDNFTKTMKASYHIVMTYRCILWLFLTCNITPSPLSCGDPTTITPNPLSCGDPTTITPSPLSCGDPTTITSRPLSCGDPTTTTLSPLSCGDPTTIIPCPPSCGDPTTSFQLTGLPAP